MERPVFEIVYNESDPRVQEIEAFTFRAEWTPTTSAAEKIRFLYEGRVGPGTREGRDPAVEIATGSSPLVATIPRADLESGRFYAILAEPPTGVFYKQEIKITLSLGTLDG